MQSRSWFSYCAKVVARISGHPITFLVAAGSVVIWALLGPVFDFSDTWQLVINTSTTIITFLMVFLIQNTQNRDTQAIQIKLDEIIRATRGAQNSVLDSEELEEAELEKIHQNYENLAEADRDELCSSAEQENENEG
jgi:low affinity Fe/Cu permease